MSTPEDLVSSLTLRVDSLELASKEKQKPWYRQHSVILSAVALVVSAATTVYTQIGSKQETIRAKKEELRKLVIALVELQQEARKTLVSPMDPENQLFTPKRGVYLQAADRLVQQIPKEVSSYEYTILANEHGGSGNGDMAEKYFSQAAELDQTPQDRAQTLRMLAVAYFSAGPRQDFEKGRRTFERANEAMAAPTDPRSIYERGLNFEAWAAMEFQNGFPENAKKRGEDARNEYGRLPENFPSRQQILDTLEDRIESGRGTFGPAQAGHPLERADRDIRRILGALSQEEAWWIIDNDIGTLTSSNEEDRPAFERWARLGLVTFMSDAEVQTINKKEKKHWTYGIAASELYGDTRAFLRNSVDELLGMAREP